MKATLNLLAAELRLHISTLCHHLRNKAYAQNSEELYSAMSSMIYYQILVDELSNLLHAQGDVIESLQKFLSGEKYDTYAADEQEPIYKYCLSRFQGEFALGSATPELTQWVATHADRNQVIRKGFYSYFPDIKLNVAERDEFGLVEFRPASEAEKFESDTEGFLRDIEASNALIEFNQLMLQVQGMLEQEVPVTDILVMLNESESK